MNHFDYLLIGGGMTADAAMSGVRQVDGEGTIGVIGAEAHLPYDRPPLSKGLWKDKPFESIWRERQDQGVQRFLSRKAVHLDLTGRRVTDDRGGAYTFRKLLLATGGTPRRFSFPDPGVIYYRTLDDYQELRSLADRRQRFGVIGGGFIGSEIAAALAMNGKQVTMMMPESGPGARVFPADLTRFLSEYYRGQGVEIREGRSVHGVDRTAAAFAVRLRKPDGAEEQVAADAVVAGLGIEPNVALAAEAGLEVDGGIVVDPYLRAGHPDVYAAGDVAVFHNAALGRRVRVEHEDNALTMGGQAGRNMAGEANAYDHLPFFYSDLFDLGYEAVGDLDSRFMTFADWAEPFRTGVVYYLRESRVCGVLLWNVWEQVAAARALIAEPGPFTPGDLKGRIPVA